MSNDESRDSLDFTPKEPAKPPAPARRKRARSADREKAASSRRVGLPVLIIGAVIVAVVLVTANHSSKEVVKSAPSAKPAAPKPQAPPVSKPSQPYPPPVAVQTPQQASPPQGVQARTLPAEFLKAVQAYNTRSGYKAMAFALDSDGKWAYGSISGWATQAGANEEALSECAKFKLKSGAESTCRLFAVGDKVVW